MGVNLIFSALRDDRQCEDRWILGVNGGLPWHVPTDLKFFNAMTYDSVVVMGRNTWNSIPPNKRPLPGRLHVVISNTLYRNSIDVSKDERPEFVTLNHFFGKSKYSNVLCFPELETAIEYLIHALPEYQIYVIGGAEIFHQMILLYPEKINNVFACAIYDIDPGYFVPKNIPVTYFGLSLLKRMVGLFEPDTQVPQVGTNNFHPNRCEKDHWALCHLYKNGNILEKKTGELGSYKIEAFTRDMRLLDKTLDHSRKRLRQKGFHI